MDEVILMVRGLNNLHKDGVAKGESVGLLLGDSALDCKKTFSSVRHPNGPKLHMMTSTMQ